VLSLAVSPSQGGVRQPFGSVFGLLWPIGDFLLSQKVAQGEGYLGTLRWLMILILAQSRGKPWLRVAVRAFLLWHIIMGSLSLPFYKYF
jgi:hypothetical protein